MCRLTDRLTLKDHIQFVITAFLACKRQLGHVGAVTVIGEVGALVEEPMLQKVLDSWIKFHYSSRFDENEVLFYAPKRSDALMTCRHTTDIAKKMDGEDVIIRFSDVTARRGTNDTWSAHHAQIGTKQSTSRLVRTQHTFISVLLPF